MNQNGDLWFDTMFNKSQSDPISIKRRSQLTNYAYTSSIMIEIINDVLFENRVYQKHNQTLGKGLGLIKELLKGEEYLVEPKDNITPKPDGTDIVRYVMMRTPIEFQESANNALSVVTSIKKRKLKEINKPNLIDARDFFRVIHTSIMDQLDIPNNPLA